MASASSTVRKASRKHGQPITPEQRAELRDLAYQAFEPDAYSSSITQQEAQRRIATLAAKLKLLDEPPYTL
jgi:hypothetical protein